MFWSSFVMIDNRVGCQSSEAVPSSHVIAHLGLAIQPTGTASDTTARAALAQSTSFCTVGAPLIPMAPTTSPFTLMGNPTPHAAIRASVGMPAKSDGSPWIKLKKSCVETPNRAVYALFCAISMVGIGAPSIRLKALRLPPSSRIATFSLTPSSLALATAAFTIFCASSKEILCFFTTLAIGFFPPFGTYCVLIIPHLAQSSWPLMSFSRRSFLRPPGWKRQSCTKHLPRQQRRSRERSPPVLPNA